MRRHRLRTGLLLPPEPLPALDGWMLRLRSFRHAGVPALLLALISAMATPAEAQAVDERVQLFDLSADVLAPGQSLLKASSVEYSRGLLPRLSLSSKLAADALGILNLEAKVALLKAEELRLAAELGVLWPASLQLLAHLLLPELSFSMVQLPMGLRASVPLAQNLELHLAALGGLSYMSLAESRQWNFGLRSELTLARYDQHGAFMLRGIFPLLTHSASSLEVFGAHLSGSLALDDLASWGVLFGREHVVSERYRIRFGLGYRNRPGIVLLQSFGHLMMELDVFRR